MASETLIPVLASLVSVIAAIFSVYFASNSRQRGSEKQYNYTRSLIEASLDPLVTISPSGKVMDVNDATISATGVDRQALIGTDFSDYFTDSEKARAGYQKVLNEGFIKDLELCLKHVNGHETPVLYNASLYRNNIGQIQGIFAAARDITEIVKLREKLQHTALYDPITNLPNRKLLEEKGQLILSEANRLEQKATVAFVDINHFKEINDSFGHETGDQLLQWFANRLKPVLRTSDVICRLGDDEFVIIFNLDNEDSIDYQGLINNALADKFPVDTGDEIIHIEISASIGSSTFPDDSEKLKELIYLADKECSKQKKNM